MEKRKVVIDMKGIKKKFNIGKPNELEILHGIDLTIYDGEFVAIVGESGSGKSTLMNIIGALDRPTEGEYFFNGKQLSKMSDKNLSKIRNKTIGFVFQNFNLISRTSALKNVELPMMYGHVSAKERSKKAKMLLDMVEMGDRYDHNPNELSGGQKQRVAIARALVLNPKILLCDEATSALDPQITKGILALLLKINKELGITIVVVTHQMEVVKEICNKVAFLKHGKMIATGKPEELFVAPNKDVQEFVGDSVEFLPKDGVNVRLFFNDETASDSAITHLAHELGINFGICQGKLENFRGTIMGSLVINVTEADRERVTAWLTDRGILWEVLENV